MKKNKLRVLAAVMIVAMAFVTMVGCGNTGDTSKPAETVATEKTAVEAATTQEPQQPQNSWEKFKSEPVTLKFYINGPWQWHQSYYSKNWISKKITEDTGVTFDFVTDPDWSDNGLNVMIASGEYPDLMHMQNGKIAIPEMISNNVFYELDELKAKTGVDLAAKMTPEMRAADRLKFNTDKLYFTRIWATVSPEKQKDKYAVKSTAAIAMIQQLYEEAGSPEIKTSDDFLNLLRKVKEKHPDMDMLGTSENNPKGVPAIIDAFSKLAGSNDPKSYVVPGKTVYFYQSPQYLEVIKFANTLYNEKLIYPTDLTDKDDQLKANLFNGKVFSKWALDYDQFDEFSNTIAKVKTGWNLTALPFFTIGNGSYIASGEYGMGGWLIDGIAKSTKYPERAAAMLDYLSSETFQKLNIYGEEGTHYDMVDGYPKLKKEIADLAVSDPEKFKMDLGFNFFDGIFRDDYWASLDRVQRSSPIQQKAFEAANSKGYLSLTGMPEAAIGYSYPADSDETKIAAAINEYIGPAVTKIMMGKPANVESGYAEMIKKLEGLGLQKLVDYWTKQMEDYKGKYDQYYK
jgi:putative aldouronate transport system substrate-binding protein